MLLFEIFDIRIIRMGNVLDTASKSPSYKKILSPPETGGASGYLEVLTNDSNRVVTPTYVGGVWIQRAT